MLHGNDYCYLLIVGVKSLQFGKPVVCGLFYSQGCGKMKRLTLREAGEGENAPGHHHIWTLAIEGLEGNLVRQTSR